MTAAHDGFVEALFNHLARRRFQHHLMAQDRSAIGLLLEVGLDARGLVAGQQARIQPPMSQFQAFAAMDDVLDWDVPFMSQCFYAFTSHPLYSIEAPCLELAI